MIDRVKGFINTSSLDLGQSSPCPGPPQYLVQKNQLQEDNSPCQGYYQQQQQQQQVRSNKHTQHQYQPYPQQPRVPPQQPSASQQPLLMPQQQQSQQHHQQQLPYQPLPQQLPLQSLSQRLPVPQQLPSTASLSSAMPGWRCTTNHYQQPPHHHLQQQNHHQYQQHHHQQQQLYQQQSTPQNISAPTPTTSHPNHTQHPQPQPSTSYTPVHEIQTQAAPSPAAHHQHLHPTAQDMAALEEEKARLEAQLREIQDRRRCVVCLDKDQGAIFMPCTHMVTCSSCATTVAACPVCRAPVHYLVPVIID